MSAVSCTHANRTEKHDTGADWSDLSLYPGSADCMTVPGSIVMRPGFTVGWGESRPGYCGGVRSLAVCQCDPRHHHIAIPYSCNRLECPVCGERALRRHSERAALRIAGYRETAYGQQDLVGNRAGGRVRDPRSGILSPPQSVVDACLRRVERLVLCSGVERDAQGLFIEQFRERVYSELSRLGLDGAAVVIHLWRVTESGKRMWRRARRGGDKRRLWEWLRGREDRQSLIYWSPHAHVAAYGWSIPGDEYHKVSGGWVWKTTRAIVGREGAFAWVHYVTSHAPIIKGKVSVTWWGCLSVKRLRVQERRKVWDLVTCPVCESRMVYASLRADGSLDHITASPMYRRKYEYVWRIVDPPPSW